MYSNDTANMIEQQRPAVAGPIRRRLWPFLLAAVLFHAAIAAALVYWNSSDRVQVVVMVDLIAGDSGDAGDAGGAGGAGDLASAQPAGQVPGEASETQTQPQTNTQTPHSELTTDDLPLDSEPAAEPAPVDGLSSNFAQSPEQSTPQIPATDQTAREQSQFIGTVGSGEVHPGEGHPDQSPSDEAHPDVPPSSPPPEPEPVPSDTATPANTASLSREQRAESGPRRDANPDRLPPVAPKPEGRKTEGARPAVPKVSADSAAGSKAGLPAGAQAGEGDQPSKQAAGLTQAPVGLYNPPPAYPARARRQGVQGTVLLRLLITSGGRVDKVDVVTSSGHRELDDAAIDAVGLWRFRPALEGGVATDQWVDVPVVFRLR